MAVEFALHGNKKEILSQLGLPSLSAKILFNGEYIEGSHQGPRERCGGKRTLSSFMTKRFTVMASGLGQFNSPQLTYSGQFYQGKLHDTTGKATCSFGTTRRYTGSFEDGHLSGPGVMENFIEGEWRVVYSGTYKLSKPWTGAHFDVTGVQMMTVHEGSTTSFGSGSGRGETGANRGVHPLPPPPTTRMPPSTLASERLSFTGVAPVSFAAPSMRIPVHDDPVGSRRNAPGE